MRALALMLLLAPGASAQALHNEPAPSALCARLAAMTQEPAVAEAHWGVSVATLAGEPLCDLNAGQLFRPASTAKLFTIATALAVLGPAHTTETSVLGSFNHATGVVTGDLTVLGGGDANLDSNDLPYMAPAERPKPLPGAANRPNPLHDLNDLAAQLVAKGVKSVTGDVVGDDTMFSDQPYPDSWNADDLVWGYGAPVSALTIGDNQMRLVVRPGAAGAAASIALQQNGVPFYTLLSTARTMPQSPAGIGVDRPVPRQLRVFGSIGTDAPPDANEIAVDDPALYAAMLFRSVLQAHGITVEGNARAKHSQPQAGEYLARLNAPLTTETALIGSAVETGQPPLYACSGGPAVPAALATHQSATLAEDAVFTAKESQNLHAELILRELAAFSHDPCSLRPADVPMVSGSRVVRAFAQRAGVDLHDFVLYDGSGLSDHDLVAPRAQTSLLVFAATQPWFPVFKSVLPVGGVDGTLGGRFKAPSPLAGKLFAKTGTLGESRALAGYMTAASGRTIVFSILVDTHLPGVTADRAAMDRMIAEIASDN
jgi:D-alanyl-D-alanine carboxypeptidase/D-alanyl-D-alanine-endopeptidase (penicillin-binding protein 4)